MSFLFYNPLCEIIINKRVNQVVIVNPIEKKWIKINLEVHEILKEFSKISLEAIIKKYSLNNDSEKELIGLVNNLVENHYLVNNKDKLKFNNIDIIDNYFSTIRNNLPSMVKRVYLSLTSSCNLKCIHCYNSVEKPKEISELDKIKIFKILEELQKHNISEIILTGGEPFLRDDIKKIINKSIDIAKKLTINTNGLLINNNIIEFLKTKKNVVVAISLDGLTKETHEKIRGKNTFKKTIKIIKRLKDNNIKVHIISTITKINYKELVYFDEFISSIGTTGNMSFYTPVGTGKMSKEILLMDDFSLNEYRSLLSKKSNVNTSNINISIPVKHNCSAGIGVLGIEHTGRVVPCHLFLGKNISLGNIMENSLVEIQNNWLDKKVITVDQNKICKDCSLRYFCGNGCLANTYYNKGTFNTNDPNCSIHKGGIEFKLWGE